MLLSKGTRSEEVKGLHRAELFSIRSGRASITRTAGKRCRDACEESAVGSEGSLIWAANAAAVRDDASGALPCWRGNPCCLAALGDLCVAAA